MLKSMDLANHLDNRRSTVSTLHTKGVQLSVETFIKSQIF